MKTIESLCERLTTGATGAFYKKSDLQNKDTLNLLTGSSLNLNGEIIEQQFQTIKIREDITEQRLLRFQVQEGDVVLLAKGNSIRAGYVTADVASLNVIASANFILLKPKKDFLMGEVLVTYFNSIAGQNELNMISRGGIIMNISLSSLKGLEVALPALDKQLEIAEVFHASNKAYQDTLSLAEQQKVVAATCIRLLMKGEA